MHKATAQHFCPFKANVAQNVFFLDTRITEKTRCTIQLELYKEFIDYCLSFVFLWTQLK